MKSDLIITRFKTTPLIGTSSSNENRTFFGSKMVYIEDEIIIDDSYIQYSEMNNPYIDPDNIKLGIMSGYPNNNGYQTYIDLDNQETLYLIYLTDLKLSNHTISLTPQQTSSDLNLNTNWSLVINWQDILSKYLFYNLKRSRVFKCINSIDVLNKNINHFIQDYISNNLINRYKFSKINFYVQYVDLHISDIEQDVNLSYTPVFDSSIKNDTNYIKNLNSTVFDKTLNVSYKQTQSSKLYSFHYYFDLVIDRV